MKPVIYVVPAMVPTTILMLLTAIFQPLQAQEHQPVPQDFQSGQVQDTLHTQNIEEVLESVARNNPELEATRKRT